jgi:acetyl esterase
MNGAQQEVAATTYSSLLDPAAEKVLLDIKAQGYPGLAYLTTTQARGLMVGFRQLAGGPEPVARIEDIRMPGNPEIPVRLYLPDGQRPLPVVVYFHGGGWIAGSCDDSDAPVRMLANRSGCAIVSVDYRLAPENKYPAALDDSYAALRWASANGDGFGWDGRKLAVAGDSAGGNLAAAVALRARNEDGPAIRLQVMIYPVLDHDYENGSYRQFGASWGVITRNDMQSFHCQYVSHPDELDLPYVSPCRCTDLSRLPNALIILAEADPLRDEALDYARRLQASGVAAKTTVYTGMIHGFWQMGGVLPQGREAIEEAGHALRACFAESSAVAASAPTGM